MGNLWYWTLLVIRYLPMLLRLVPAVVALVHEVEAAIQAGVVPPTAIPRSPPPVLRNQFKLALRRAARGSWGDLVALHGFYRSAGGKKA